MSTQTTYNDIGKISMIEQDDYQTTFSYGPDHERWRSCLTDDGNTVRTVLYGGDYERVVVGDTVREFYYPGHGIIVMKQGGTFTVCVAATDALGSILRLFDQQGNTLYSAYYDAWGVAAVDSNKIAFHRGYSGHEMLPEYGLINMNGRLYDPQIGRFLSPDNYVQLPDLSQSFNRYSYCLNNPLKYTDPDGNIFFSILSAFFAPNLMPLAMNMDYAWISGGFKADMEGKSFISGAFKGVVSSSIDGLSLFYGGASMPFGLNILLGAAEGAASGAISSLLWGDNVLTGMKNGVIRGSVISAVTSAEFNNFLRGKGFKSNEAVLRDFRLGKYSSDYLNWHQDALDYFGFDGEFVLNNPLFENRENNPGITTLDGKIYYNYSAFKSYDYLHYVSDHEVKHRMDIMSGITDYDTHLSLYEFKTYIYNYKRQGLYPKFGENLSLKINHFGTESLGLVANQDEFIDSYLKYTYDVPRWHIFYKIPRRW